MKGFSRVATFIEQTKPVARRRFPTSFLPNRPLRILRLRQLKPSYTPLQVRRPASTMSDEDYEAFLNKANQDVGGATAQSKKSVGIKAVDTEIPQGLEKVNEVFVSDADEPFEPVSLKYSGDSLPSKGKIASLSSLRQR
jgi:hypothetical protein